LISVTKQVNPISVVVVVGADWQESGVTMPPEGSAPRGTGHGRELIEQALPYPAEGADPIRYGPDGIRCTIFVPVSATTSGRLAAC
jgi:hypothetical protein